MTGNAATRPLHIVVTCSNRKRHGAPPQLRAGSLTQKTAAGRFAAWSKRLDTSTSSRFVATDLYAGEHWQVARTLIDAAARPGAQLWIASAGYGLIPADAAICSYAATFSSPAPDTVGQNLSEVRDWWSRLGEWPGPAPTQPRTFASLAQRDPSTIMIAILSEAYQRACGHDLATAAKLLGSEALSVIGPPEAQEQLAEVLVPVTAVLRHTVGGSLQALNIRVAKHLLLTATNLGRSALRDAASAAMPTQPPPQRAAGRRVTDAELRAYVCGSPHTSATQLLRQLRLKGQSCEQGRFKQIHDAVCPGHRS